MLAAKFIRRLAAVPVLALGVLAVTAVPSLAAVPQTAGTLPATGVTAAAAMLNGTVNPEGNDTTYQFEYGTTVAYGTVTASVNAGNGFTTEVVSANVTGLAPSTTYHFQILAVVAGTAVPGGDMSFTTLAAGAATPSATPSMTPTAAVTPSVTPSVTPTPSAAAGTVAGCTAALVAFAQAHGTMMTAVTAFDQARVLADCRGLGTAQLEQAAFAAVTVLNGNGGTAPAVTPAVTQPAAAMPVGAPGTGGGTGPAAAGTALAAGVLLLLAGTALLARRMRKH